MNYMPNLSLRGWITTITIILLTIVVIAAWPEIVNAWNLLGQVNLWILALLVPVQLFSYFATGGMIFAYLRSKGNLKEMSQLRMTRTALELNFVNHILPSGGAAGFSYLGWVLTRYGVTPGRSTMAQIIRFVLTFLSFAVLLVVAVIFLIVDHQISRVVTGLSVLLTVLAVGSTIGIVYLIGSKPRLTRFSLWLTNRVNRLVSVFTRGKKKDAIKEGVILTFFIDIHDDFVAIRRDKRILIKPFIWAILANVADVTLLWVAFWSLGYMVNPAVLFVAFGLASIASVLSVAPGGAGIYETIMIAFLATTGVPATIAIAGTLLARVSLILMTIAFGYIFYQLTVNKYGRRPPHSQ
jgi:putative heme transporter